MSLEVAEMISSHVPFTHLPCIIISQLVCCVISKTRKLTPTDNFLRIEIFEVGM